MIFTDYPGHFVVMALIVIFAVVVFAIFRMGELAAAERRRYRRLLMALQYAVILSLLLILWNPSAWQAKEVFGRNTVLAVFDTSESMSVIEDGRLTRLDKALAKFAEHFEAGGPAGPEYRIHGFDDHAYHGGSPELLRRWGPQTNLHGVFSLLAEEAPPSPSSAGQAHGPVPAAGAVIFTDGRADDRDPRRYLAVQRDDVPILFVGVGPRRPRMDVAVESIVAPASTWVDTAFTATVTVRATNVMTEPVTLELLRDDTVVDSRPLGRKQFRSLGAGAFEATIEFTLPATRLGTQVLTARVKPPRGEINLANNARSTSVEVTQERTLKVLLYTQWANFDVGKIRRALAWDKRIHLDLGFDVIKDSLLADRVWQNSAQVKLPETKEALYEYDVIILGPCDIGDLTSVQWEALYGFVSERGGGLLLLPGRTVTSLAVWDDRRAEVMLPAIFDREYSRLWPPRPDAIRLTFEAQVSHLFDPNVFANPEQRISPFYETVEPKPASMTLATAGEMPIVAAHRLGRGRVCLLNASKLFMLYREDRQGGALSELVCNLVAWLGRTPAQGAGVELFVERAADDPRRLAFTAYVVDKTFQPVTGANVLLTVRDAVVSMEPTGTGYYRTALDWGPGQSVIAGAQAEVNGAFLGERTVATNLPAVRDEMSCVDLDEPFLQALASQVSGRYLHIDEIDGRTARLFVPKHQVGVTETVSSIWPRWPVLVALCVMPSVGWFIRRGIGLV